MVRLISSIRTVESSFDSIFKKQQPVAVVLTLQRLENYRMQSDELDRRLSQRFSRWTAISSLALIAVTWRLWTPQTIYPQVPVLQRLCSAPGWLDWLALTGTLVGLIALAVSNRPFIARIACSITMLSLVVLFSLDQHRFQPWAYELWLFCGVWLCCRDPWRMVLMRWLLISIYFYSAMGKLDFEFLHTVGQQMLAVVIKCFGIEPTDLSFSFRLAIAATFPCIELLVAIGLMWDKTRRLAGWLAISVHLGLIVILGPLGLNHRLGVLVWNAQVAVQAYWLFVPEQTVEPKRTTFTLFQSFATAMIGLAIALPITERFELWDHWPSWALYAPHSSRVHIEIAGSAVDRLPAELRDLVDDSPTDPDAIAVWLPVPIDKWSLKTLDTPIYPQARFQLGVAERLATDINAGFQMRFVLLGTANRLTGLRRSTTYDGLTQLKTMGNRFWLNRHPRVWIKVH